MGFNSGLKGICYNSFPCRRIWLLCVLITFYYYDCTATGQHICSNTALSLSLSPVQYHLLPEHIRFYSGSGGCACTEYLVLIIVDIILYKIYDFKIAVFRSIGASCSGSGSESKAFHRGDSGLIPGQSVKVKLTLRRLMSYIYLYIYMEHTFLMFLDHTQRRSTVGRTPLDE